MVFPFYGSIDTDACMEGKSAGCFDSIIFENDSILRLFTPMCNKSSLHIVKAMNFMLNYNELNDFIRMSGAALSESQNNR